LWLFIPKPAKPKNTNYKSQITNNFQWSKTQIPNLFRSLNIEIWDLFGICALLFEIFYY